MEAKQKHESYGLWTWIGLAGLTLAAMVTAVCVGSVNISVRECLQVFKAALTGAEAADPGTASILLSVRLPRVLCVALSGAALSVCGAAMQGLLKNPLADGSTLG
ncbi:MAG: iron chelate uptake ABC transporter family permease subunit, partial [Candidatus Limivicinus sp.]